jgi:hypothetical protein
MLLLIRYNFLQENIQLTKGKEIHIVCLLKFKMLDLTNNYLTALLVFKALRD